MFEQWKRARFAKVAPEPLRDFFTTPPVSASTPIAEAAIASIDLETTGLKIGGDQILSFAAVFINSGYIRLQQAYYNMVQAQELDKLEESAVIHGIHTEEIKQGVTIEQLLLDLYDLLKGKVILAHNTATDWGFLNRASKNVLGYPLLVPVIDTLKIEKKRLERQQTVLTQDTLTLAACRKRYGLPDFSEHDARSDALAAAELLLAQVAQMGGAQRVLLKDLGMVLMS